MSNSSGKALVWPVTECEDADRYRTGRLPLGGGLPLSPLQLHGGSHFYHSSTVKHMSDLGLSGGIIYDDPLWRRQKYNLRLGVF